MSAPNKISPKINNRVKGFSLVELLVVVVMFGILVTAGYNLFNEQTKVNRAQQNMLDLQSSGRTALQILIHHFSHAGFGSSDNYPDFIIHNDKEINDDDSDSVTLRYGHTLYGGNVVGNHTDTLDITIDDTTLMSSGKNVCFFPSFSPNKFYKIDVKSTTSIELDKKVDRVSDNAKIFLVSDVKIEVIKNASNETSLQQTINGSTENIIYDVVEFHIAYTDKDDLTNWETNIPAKNIKAAWIYILLKSKDRDPGYKNDRTFFLPWNNSTLNNSKIEDGFHYQEFETKVWLRNAS